ncbi:MAG: hypothetical protein HRT52_13610 [Colwellia sp.]|nr:hypothetical protein [Colwellia sp.]
MNWYKVTRIKHSCDLFIIGLIPPHIKDVSRFQIALFPEVIDDFVSAETPVRVIDVFVGGLDLENLGFKNVKHENTSRLGYHPATLLKIYIYSHLNSIWPSLCLAREIQRNIELIRFKEPLFPDV